MVSAASKLKAIAQTPASLWKMTHLLRMTAALCTGKLDARERTMRLSRHILQFNKPFLRRRFCLSLIVLFGRKK